MTNKVRSVIVYTNGFVEEKEIIPDLPTLQGIVGGWIEGLPLPNHVLMFCNEDGKSMGLSLNKLATIAIDRLWPGFAQVDVLLGDVVFIGSTSAGSETDCPSGIVAMLKDLASDGVWS